MPHTQNEKEGEKIYTCRNCGVSLTNRADWCDLGCGRDYNEMYEVKRLGSLLALSRQEGREEVLKILENMRIEVVDPQERRKRVLKALSPEE